MKGRSKGVSGGTRRRAEQRLSERPPPEAGEGAASASDAAALVHELRVHQIELEMQNEELELSRAEAEAARERYADLYDFAPIGYFTVTRDSSIREANLTGARLLGVERSQLLGRRLGALVAEADRPAFNAALARAIESQAQEACGVTLAAAPGAAASPVYLQMTISASPGGEELRVVAVDATERKRSEDQVRTSQKLEAIGQLAGGVAHDFNNLLTIILSNAEVALRDVAAGTPGHESLLELTAAGRRAAALTRQLLAFSRKQVVRPRTVDLNTLMRNIGDMLRRLVGEQIDLQLSLAPDVAPVEVDPVQLDQVMMNLAVNARDAMPSGGALTLSTANLDPSVDDRRRGPNRSGPFVRLTVTDTGTGMDAATMEHIFEPFFSTKREGHGTGLGLATVFGIVKRCGGEIAVRSEPGAGTTFAIDLPRSLAPLPSRSPSGEKEASPRRGTETILLVEDEGALLRIAERTLRSAGYTVLAASSGAEALRVCERHPDPIDLAVSDLVMPGMSGATFGAHLRRVHPETKLLYMSGYTADALTPEHGVMDPAVPLLNKPFTGAELARKVRDVLEGSVGGAPIGA